MALSRRFSNIKPVGTDSTEEDTEDDDEIRLRLFGKKTMFKYSDPAKISFDLCGRDSTTSSDDNDVDDDLLEDLDPTLMEEFQHILSCCKSVKHPVKKAPLLFDKVFCDMSKGPLDSLRASFENYCQHNKDFEEQVVPENPLMSGKIQEKSESVMPGIDETGKQKEELLKLESKKLLQVSNSLESDQTLHYTASDLEPNCLQMKTIAPLAVKEFQPDNTGSVEIEVRGEDTSKCDIQQPQNKSETSTHQSKISGRSKTEVTDMKTSSHKSTKQDITSKPVNKSGDKKDKSDKSHSEKHKEKKDNSGSKTSKDKKKISSENKGTKYPKERKEAELQMTESKKIDSQKSDKHKMESKNIDIKKSDKHHKTESKNIDIKKSDKHHKTESKNIGIQKSDKHHKTESKKIESQKQKVQKSVSWKDAAEKGEKTRTDSCSEQSHVYDVHIEKENGKQIEQESSHPEQNDKQPLHDSKIDAGVEQNKTTKPVSKDIYSPAKMKESCSTKSSDIVNEKKSVKQDACKDKKIPAEKLITGHETKAIFKVSVPSKKSEDVKKVKTYAITPAISFPLDDLLPLKKRRASEETGKEDSCERQRKRHATDQSVRTSNSRYNNSSAPSQCNFSDTPSMVTDNEVGRVFYGTVYDGSTNSTMPVYVEDYQNDLQFPQSQSSSFPANYGAKEFIMSHFISTNISDIMLAVNNGNPDIMSSLQEGLQKEIESNMQTLLEKSKQQKRTSIEHSAWKPSGFYSERKDQQYIPDAAGDYKPDTQPNMAKLSEDLFNLCVQQCTQLVQTEEDKAKLMILINLLKDETRNSLASTDTTQPRQSLASTETTQHRNSLASTDTTQPRHSLASTETTQPRHSLASTDTTQPRLSLASTETTQPRNNLAIAETTQPRNSLTSTDTTHLRNNLAIAETTQPRNSLASMETTQPKNSLASTDTTQQKQEKHNAQPELKKQSAMETNYDSDNSLSTVLTGQGDALFEGRTMLKGGVKPRHIPKNLVHKPGKSVPLDPRPYPRKPATKVTDIELPPFSLKMWGKEKYDKVVALGEICSSGTPSELTRDDENLSYSPTQVILTNPASPKLVPKKDHSKQCYSSDISLSIKTKHEPVSLQHGKHSQSSSQSNDTICESSNMMSDNTVQNVVEHKDESKEMYASSKLTQDDEYRKSISHDDHEGSLVLDKFSDHNRTTVNLNPSENSAKQHDQTIHVLISKEDKSRPERSTKRVRETAPVLFKLSRHAPEQLGISSLDKDNDVIVVDSVPGTGKQISIKTNEGNQHLNDSVIKRKELGYVNLKKIPADVPEIPDIAQRSDVKLNDKKLSEKITPERKQEEKLNATYSRERESQSRHVENKTDFMRSNKGLYCKIRSDEIDCERRKKDQNETYENKSEVKSCDRMRSNKLDDRRKSGETEIDRIRSDDIGGKRRYAEIEIGTVRSNEKDGRRKSNGKEIGRNESGEIDSKRRTGSSRMRSGEKDNRRSDEKDGKRRSDDVEYNRIRTSESSGSRRSNERGFDRTRPDDMDRKRRSGEKEIGKTRSSEKDSKRRSGERGTCRVRSDEFGGKRRSYETETVRIRPDDVGEKRRSAEIEIGRDRFYDRDCSRSGETGFDRMISDEIDGERRTYETFSKRKSDEKSSRNWPDKTVCRMSSNEKSYRRKIDEIHGKRSSETSVGTMRYNEITYRERSNITEGRLCDITYDEISSHEIIDNWTADDTQCRTRSDMYENSRRHGHENTSRRRLSDENRRLSDENRDLQTKSYSMEIDESPYYTSYTTDGYHESTLNKNQTIGEFLTKSDRDYKARNYRIRHLSTSSAESSVSRTSSSSRITVTKKPRSNIHKLDTYEVDAIGARKRHQTAQDTHSPSNKKTRWDQKLRKERTHSLEDPRKLGNSDHSISINYYYDTDLRECKSSDFEVPNSSYFSSEAQHKGYHKERQSTRLGSKSAHMPKTNLADTCKVKEIPKQYQVKSPVASLMSPVRDSAKATASMEEDKMFLENFKRRLSGEHTEKRPAVVSDKVPVHGTKTTAAFEEDKMFLENFKRRLSGETAEESVIKVDKTFSYKEKAQEREDRLFLQDVKKKILEKRKQTKAGKAKGQVNIKGHENVENTATAGQNVLSFDDMLNLADLEDIHN